MLEILKIVLVVVCVFLIGAVLMQTRGAGLSVTFGGDGGAYRTKRGAEKFLFISTIILGVIFFLLSLIVPLYNQLAALFS